MNTAVITLNSMDRLSQKNELMVKLGRLFGPLQSLSESPEKYDEQERAETVARFMSEHIVFIKEFHTFSLGQPGHNYQIEWLKLHNALTSVGQRIPKGDDLSDIIEESLPKATEAIHAVPVPRSSIILEAGTPFSAYSKLRSLCEADASHSIKWFDPYFGPDIFQRYLQFTKSNLHITLVTSEPGPHAGRKNRQRWDNFVDVSRLFAVERGTSGYNLLVASSIHDRWLVLDDKRIYNLGGSAKDAAFKDLFTISVIDATDENLKNIEVTEKSAAEWFGPGVTSHQ